MTSLARLFFDIVEDGVGLWKLLLGLGLDHLAQPKAQAIEHRGHGARGGQLLVAIALLCERRQGRLGRQPRVGQARAKRRVLLCMRLGKLMKRFSRLRMPLCPAFAATEGRLRPKTNDSGASLRQTACHSLAAPTEEGFG